MSRMWEVMSCWMDEFYSLHCKWIRKLVAHLTESCLFSHIFYIVILIRECSSTVYMEWTYTHGIKFNLRIQEQTCFSIQNQFRNSFYWFLLLTWCTVLLGYVENAGSDILLNCWILILSSIILVHSMSHSKSFNTILVWLSCVRH